MYSKVFYLCAHRFFSLKTLKHVGYRPRMHSPCKDLSSKCHFHVEMMAKESFGGKHKKFQEIGFKRSAPNQCHPCQ
jgi:hypothetical protein